MRTRLPNTFFVQLSSISANISSFYSYMTGHDFQPFTVEKIHDAWSSTPQAQKGVVFCSVYKTYSPPVIDTCFDHSDTAAVLKFCAATSMATTHDWKTDPIIIVKQWWAARVLHYLSNNLDEFPVIPINLNCRQLQHRRWRSLGDVGIGWLGGFGARWLSGRLSPWKCPGRVTLFAFFYHDELQ